MRLRLTLSALIPLLPGCFTYPCETDVLACEQGDAFDEERIADPEVVRRVEELVSETCRVARALRAAEC